MQFKGLAILCLFAASRVAADVIVVKRETSTVDLSALLSQLATVTAALPSAGSISLPSFTTPLSGVELPPLSLVGIILTALPTSVITELLNPSARSSIASEFKAGNTPGWYQSLDPAVKSYIQGTLKVELTGGTVSKTGTAATGTAAGATATSKGAAAKPTGALAASFVGALGVLGLAVAL